MSKARSPETEIKYLRSDLRRAEGSESAWKATANSLTLKVGRLEAEVAEWKARFDALFDRIPKVKP
jgi:chromosome segregation ATPase